MSQGYTSTDTFPSVVVIHENCAKMLFYNPHFFLKKKKKKKNAYPGNPPDPVR